MNNKFKKSFHDILNIKTSKCLFPGNNCNKSSIKAHSIQNAKVFELLNRDGHLIGLKSKTDKFLNPIFSFTEIGRNKASIFEGLCKEHDIELFKIIDNNHFDSTNIEQLFLIAYRSILKELHESNTKAVKYQLSYRHLIDSKLLRGDIPTKAGLISTQMLIDFYNTQEYKNLFDNALQEREFEYLTHWIFKIETKCAVIACSQLFSVDSVRFKDTVLRLVLNVFPFSSSKTYVIFSSSKDEKQLAEDYLTKCLHSNSFALNYEISKLILWNSDNFFINPDHYNSWSDSKKDSILDYALETIFNDIDKDNIDFYLF